MSAADVDKELERLKRAEARAEFLAEVRPFFVLEDALKAVYEMTSTPYRGFAYSWRDSLNRLCSGALPWDATRESAVELCRKGLLPFDADSLFRAVLDAMEAVRRTKVWEEARVKDAKTRLTP